MVIACCLVASFGMSSKNQISAKRLSAFKEWLVRFGIFVVLPTLFFFFCGHLIDLFVASPSSQPAPWEIEFYPLQGGCTLLIIFFLISFFFLVSTFLAKYSFVFGSVILLFFYITVPAILPKREVLAQRLVRGFAPNNGFYHRHDGGINRSFLHHIMV